MKNKIPLLVLMSLLLLCHCGRSSSPTVISSTTVGDTLIVVNTPPDEDPPTLYRFERDLVIGVAEGEEPYMLISSTWFNVDDDGNIYSGHLPDGEVRVFNPNGTFLRRFGRRGEGPGEFSSNATFGIYPLESGLVAVEDIPFQLELYDDHGLFQRSIDLRMLPMKAEKQGYFGFSIPWVSDDTLLIPWRKSAFGEESHHWFLITDEELGARKWIDAGVTPSSTFADGESFHALPYQVLFRWTTTGDGVVVWGTNHDYQLTRYDVVNDRWIKIIFELEPVPFTNQDRQDYIRDELDGYPAERRAWEEAALRKMPYPDHFPQITSLLGDDEGNIWVCRYIKEPWRQHPEGFRYDLFDARGEWQGIVDSPRLWDCIRGGNAYASGQEEYPTIERYRMIRSR